MKPEKTYLDKLTPTTKAYKVKVKLKEKSRTLISPQKKTRYQQLLFEDEKGNTMRGALFENQIEEYESVFKSNQEYEIANAPLKPVLGRYATRDDDCQMSFGGQATIQPLDPEAKSFEPEYVPIAAIPRTTDLGDRFDVLGIVLFVEETRTITTASGVAHQVREVVITDPSTDQPLTISVWDDLTGTEASLLKSWVGPALIVGFTSLKPSAHKGFSLSTTMATEFHRNPVGERANALRKWSEEQRPLVLERMARICEVRNPAQHDEILTIDAIKQKEVGNTLQEEKHWIKVTIPEPERSRIVPYVGCNNCGKRTENDCDVSYTCKFCNKEKCIATPRITFKFDATDDTGEMTFTAFTQECEALFKLPASEIYAQITTGMFKFEPIAHHLSTTPFLLQIGPATALARNKILTWVPKAIRWN
ncbi:replication protein A 70 kDa DNA-binding subunit D-like [Beta vulgaris subsp. vulgaris]|uniref:replication protein A 70 kDa DNA-binding subunit D-like n=1 Tax=Beta vulgaris subsp. vulgaris TaxID=3555 RepID=UPI00053F79EC|nr:replication protein A 70 kDa DNA-binding subunit D-like [Beta vulgaris subsp. vulgaris]XP_010691529.1 replication protein A 70 kDa DNA-binding subunit D-like [Beta vulgaris subsp. vulgaris]